MQYLFPFLSCTVEIVCKCALISFGFRGFHAAKQGQAECSSNQVFHMLLHGACTYFIPRKVISQGMETPKCDYVSAQPLAGHIHNSHFMKSMNVMFHIFLSHLVHIAVCAAITIAVWRAKCAGATINFHYRASSLSSSVRHDCMPRSGAQCTGRNAVYVFLVGCFC